MLLFEVNFTPGVKYIISIVIYFVASGCYAAGGSTGYIAIHFKFISRAE